MDSSEWEIRKVSFIVICLFLAGLSNWAVLAYTHDIVGREPLPDIVFSLIPQVIWAAKVGDAFVTLCLIFFATLLVFHQERIIIIRRVFFIAATLYTMRSVTLLVTQLPPGYADSTVRCRERRNFSWGAFLSRWGEQTVRVGFQSEDSMLCGDMLFSGHSLVMMLCYLSVSHYLPRNWKKFKWISCVSSYAGMASMVVSRTHYTVDVVIAYWLTTLVFASYHAYAESDLFMDRKDSVYYSYVYFRVVSWLEESIVPGRVENVFVNPIRQIQSMFDPKPSETAQGHHKHISVSSSSTFALPA